MDFEDDASTLRSASRRSSITVQSDAASSVFSPRDCCVSESSASPAARRRSSQISDRLRRLSLSNSLTVLLFQAAERGDLATLQTHLHGNSELSRHSGKDDVTLLHVAAGSNSIPVVSYLLSLGMSVSSRTKRQGREPLYFAAKQNALECAAVLIDQGRAVVSARSKHDGATALHKAASEGHEEMVRLLLTAGADVDAPDNEDLRPINWAIQTSRLPVVRLLLDNGASTKARTNKGFTALQRAVTTGDPEIVRILAERGGYAAVNAEAPFGVRALHQAAYDNKIEIMQLLISARAALDVRTQKGWTPLHCAARYGFSEACRMLVESGADEEALTNKGKTPRTLAEQWKHAYCASDV